MSARSGERGVWSFGRVGGPSRARVPSAASIGALLLTVGPAPRAQEPTLQVLARARFHVLRARTVEGVAHITGELRDDLGRPLPAAPVVLEGDSQNAARTDPEGRFTLRPADLPEGSHTARLHFPGNELLAGARASLRVHVGRARGRLRLASEPTVRAGEPSRLTVALEGVSLPAGGAGAWRLEPGAPNPLAFGGPPDAPTAALELPGLPRGRHPLHLAFAGDRDHAPCELPTTVLARAPAAVTLRHGLTAAGLALRGGVRPPIPDATVRLHGPAGVLAEATTDADGAFSFWLPRGALRAGSHALRALFFSPDESVEDATSAPVRVEIPARPPPPEHAPADLWPGLVAALLALGALLLGERRRPAPPRRRAPPDPTPVGPTVAPVAGTARTLRVVDALTGAPLCAAVVADPASASYDPLAPPGAPTPCGLGGCPLPAAASLWIGSPGYAPAVATVPRRGGLEVGLVGFAAAIRARFDEALAAAGAPALRFGQQTPAEAAAALARRGCDRSRAEALGALVAHACFAAAPPGPAQLGAVHALAAQLGPARATPPPPALRPLASER